jgi:Protein of unknown function (DUF4239)
MVANGTPKRDALHTPEGVDRSVAEHAGPGPKRRSRENGQHEIVSALETALEARRQRIVISQSSVSTVKWAGLLLQALCTLVAIAMVHSDNRTTCQIALTLFATGIALSVLLIAAYSRPFTGEISVGPTLLKRSSPSRVLAEQTRRRKVNVVGFTLV